MPTKDHRLGAPKDEIEITPEMIEAGEEIILAAVGGFDVGGFFSSHDLAKAVYSAMEQSRLHCKASLR